MGFEHILGQPTAVETLRRALAQGRVHHAYRFEGPEGVGKELTAMALAQALVCEQDQFGCGVCSACHRVVQLSETPPHVPQHPDVILVARGLYSGSVLTSKESTGISVEQIRKIVLGRAQYTPHEAPRMVFIIRDADEISVAAANALLKTLEEPRPDVNFILLTSRPNRLLDTVRSRTLAVRFGPLPDAVLERILSEQGQDTALAARSQGSAKLALELADETRLELLRGFSERLQAAVDAKEMSLALQLAGDLPRDRRQLRDQLLHYAQELALAARTQVDAAPQRAEQSAKRYSILGRCLDALEANVSPALAVEALVCELRSA